MKLKVTGIVLTLFLISTLTLAFNIQPIKAEPTTWAMDDGPQVLQIVRQTEDDYSWPMYEHDIMRTSYTSENLILPLELQWTYEVNGYVFVPIVRSGLLCFGTWDRVYAMNLTTRSVEWSFNISGYVNSESLTLVDDILYFGSNNWMDVWILGYINSTLFALNATSGKVLWKHDFGDAGFNSILVCNGRAYIGTRNGTLYTLNSETGELFWKVVFPKQMGEPIKVQKYPPIPQNSTYIGYAAYADGLIYFTVGYQIEVKDPEDPEAIIQYLMTSLYAIDADNGDVAWNRTVAPRDAMWSYPVKVSGGMVYTKFLQALNGSNGELIWEYPIGWSGNDFAVSPEAVFISHSEDPRGLGDCYLVALNATNGNPIWKITIGPYGTQLHYPIVADEVLYGATGYWPPEKDQFTLIALNTKNGQKLWDYPFNPGLSAGYPIIANGMFYIALNNVSFYDDIEYSSKIYAFKGQKPIITILSPENKTYSVNTVSLTFTVDKTTSWIGYSLDGQANMTITGNTTLSGLSEGSHSLIVYAKDTAGNTGASEIIYFSIKTKKAEPFPTLIVAAIVVIAVVGAALLVYFTKVKKRTEKVK